MSASAASSRLKTCSLWMSTRVFTSVTGSPRTTRCSGKSAPARRSRVLKVPNMKPPHAGSQTRVHASPEEENEAPIANEQQPTSVPPDRACLAASVLIKLDRARHLGLGNQNDLAQMQREVLHHLIHRIEHRDLTRLDLEPVAEPGWIESREHGVG